MKTILTRFSSLAVMVLLMVILVLPQNAQAAVSLVDLQAALSSLQAKLTQLVGGGQTAQVLSSVADTDVLLDLQLDAGGPTDGSAYASNVSTRKQYDLESALGKKVYRVSDYASISVDRSNKQIYNLEKGSFEFNFKRFTPATGVGPLVTIYQSWKISLTIAGEISFYFPSSDGTAYTITTSGANIMDVAWHNVVVNFDGSAGVAEIYVDGVLRGQGAVGGTTKPVKYWGLTIPDQYNDSFDGYMDGLRMYARPLTVAEVKTAASQLQTQVSYGDIAAPDYVRPADLKKIPSAPFSATKTVSDAAGLTSALSAAKEGDVILLQSGNYGDFAITKYFTSYITIAAAAGATPVFNSLDVTGSYIHVSGVTITPATAVHALDLNGLHNVFENSTIQFGDIDISGWDATKWKTTAGGGIYTAGFQNIIRNNTLTNVGFGIVNTGSYGLISNNRIDGYSGDAMRSLGHYMIVENNYAINCIEVDANHDDMFQAWTRSEDSNKTLYGVVLRGNVFINNDNRPAAAVIGTTQGIGLFDGFYENWLIENNFIMVNSYHGIGIYGAKNITIKNNTVIDSKDGTPGPLWIGIFNHKNGTVPENVTIENNLSNRIAGTGTGVTKTNNASVSFANYENYFVDIANFDYRLKSSAPVSGVGADPNYVPTALPVAHTGATVAQSSDTDGDGIVDTKDNCVNIANRTNKTQTKTASVTYVIQHQTVTLPRLVIQQLTLRKIQLLKTQPPPTKLLLTPPLQLSPSKVSKMVTLLVARSILQHCQLMLVW